MKKQVKLGIFGLRRGATYINHFLANNADIVAACDKSEIYTKKAKELLGKGTAFYTDFDEFLNHDMDAVFIANYFHEHTPYAIKCLEKDIHVLSECTSNSTMAEGVALVRAAKKSKAFYMLAENYPFMTFNREMKKICENGSLGKILYAEGEYNHPRNEANPYPLHLLFDQLNHWRRYQPRTYYITHSLAPLMYTTGATPKRVTALPIYAPNPKNASAVGDIGAILTMVNDDDSVFKVTGHSSFGFEENSYRFCGENGMVENVRGSGGKIALNYNEWQVPEGLEQCSFYKPQINDKDEALIKNAGHDGGDFFVARIFIDCVRNNQKPEMDEYFATTMASVGILGHRSLLEGGMPYDIPDFRKEEDRIKYENDHISPFYHEDGREPTIPCCSHTDFRANEEAVARFKKRLEESL